jgi:predicted ester cyclase
MPHDLRQLSRDWFEQVWNQRDEPTIRRLADPHVSYQGLGENGGVAVGYDQFMQFRAALLSAFPDLRCIVEDVLVDGDKTAVRVVLSGTHSGEGIGIAPTGRPITATGIVILRWHNGRIVEGWNEFDAAGMQRQLQSPTCKLRP